MTLRTPIPFCWDRLHHGYVGIVIIIVGYLMKSTLVILIGALVFIDDIIEHTITGDTPLRSIYENTIQSSLPDCSCDVT